MRVPAPWGSRQCSCTAASGRSLALTLPETGRADGPRGLPRRGEETAPPVGTTRRAVHGGATGGGDPRVRLTGCGPRAAAVDAVTPGVYRPRGLDGCVATFKKRPENSWSSRPGSVSCSHFEQLVDELKVAGRGPPARGVRTPGPRQAVSDPRHRPPGPRTISRPSRTRPPTPGPSCDTPPCSPPRESRRPS